MNELFHRKRIALLIAVGILLTLSEACSAYFPTREIVMTPAARGLTFEAVTLQVPDAPPLSAWYLPAEKGKKVLLFYHGNGGNISYRVDSLELFHQLGLSVLIFDYQGYGSSEGSPSEEGTYADARAAWAYLTKERGFAPDDIILFGRSLGAAVAAKLATETDPHALILESAFTSLPAAGRDPFGSFLVWLLLCDDYDTEQIIAEIDCPLLLIHSRDDTTVAYPHAEALYRAAREPKKLLPLTGTHNTGFLTSGPLYTEAIREFLQSPHSPAP